MTNTSEQQDSVNTLPEDFIKEVTDTAFRKTIEDPDIYVEDKLREAYERGRADERAKIKEGNPVVGRDGTVWMTTMSSGVEYDERAKIEQAGDWEKEFDEKFRHCDDLDNGGSCCLDDEHLHGVKSFFSSVIEKEKEKARIEQIKKDAGIARKWWEQVCVTANCKPPYEEGKIAGGNERAQVIENEIRSQLTPSTPESSNQSI